MVPLPTTGGPHNLVQPSWPSYPTTYSSPPNLGPIYNPAPPPSTYMTFPAPNLATNQSPRYSMTPPPSSPSSVFSYSGSSGGGGSIRHTLAASGSGSESDAGTGANIANLSISSYPKHIQGVTS